jgi:hypothetical protein
MTVKLLVEQISLPAMVFKRCTRRKKSDRDIGAKKDQRPSMQNDQISALPSYWVDFQGNARVRLDA